jgi:hypothetical protein
MNHARIRYSKRPRTITLRETIVFLASVIIIVAFIHWQVTIVIEIVRQMETIIDIPLLQSCGA